MPDPSLRFTISSHCCKISQSHRYIFPAAFAFLPLRQHSPYTSPNLSFAQGRSESPHNIPCKNRCPCRQTIPHFLYLMGTEDNTCFSSITHHCTTSTHFPAEILLLSPYAHSVYSVQHLFPFSIFQGYQAFSCQVHILPSSGNVIRLFTSTNLFSLVCSYVLFVCFFPKRIHGD